MFVVIIIGFNNGEIIILVGINQKLKKIRRSSEMKLYKKPKLFFYLMGFKLKNSKGEIERERNIFFGSISL